MHPQYHEPTATAAQTADRQCWFRGSRRMEFLSFHISRVPRFLPASEQMNTAVLPPLDETGVW